MIRGLTKEDKSLLMEALGSLIDELTDDFLEAKDDDKREAINDKIYACEDLIQKLERKIGGSNMFKVYYIQYVDDAYGKHIDYSWEEYSGIARGSELDAMDEYTKARLEGYTCMIKEV